MMPRRLSIVLIVASVIALACKDVTTVVEEATEFQTRLSVTSPILEATGDTLVGDTVRFSVTVTRDGTAFRTSDPIFETSDSTVVKLLDTTTGEAVFESTGRATVSVSFTGQEFPDSLLRAAMVVAVDSLSVSLSLESAIVTKGDTLVGDTVMFNARVFRKDGREIKTLAQYESSDTGVVRLLNANSGMAELVGPGTAEVAVTFLLPIVPGEPLQAVIPVHVTDFALQLTLASLWSGAIESGDTLVTDSVQLGVWAQKGGEPITIVDPSFSSSDPAVVKIVDSAQGRAVFVDTGTAEVTVDFSEPDLPKVNASRSLRVTTYLAQLKGPSSPVMGDELRYGATVVDTRSGEEVGTAGRTFASTDPSVLQILDAGEGDAFARDIGLADLRVSFSTPTLPHGSIEQVMPVSVSEERFYGVTSHQSGDFGDFVRINSSAVHHFTASSWVEFPNGTVGFRDDVTSSRIYFQVPAGASSGHLRLHDLVDDQGNPRNNVLTYWLFDSQGTVEDEFEPNDVFPLSKDVRITSLPWEHLLSVDPSKTAPPDTNFFWFKLSSARTFDFMAEWQQDADIDFKLCLGEKEPPKDYKRDKNDQPLCARGPGANSRDRSAELGLGTQLEKGTWILAFYCHDCPAVPLTYRARFDWP